MLHYIIAQAFYQFLFVHYLVDFFESKRVNKQWEEMISFMKKRVCMYGDTNAWLIQTYKKNNDFQRNPVAILSGMQTKELPPTTMLARLPDKYLDGNSSFNALTKAFTFSPHARFNH